MSEHWGFETRQIHVGGEPDATTGARAVPIYQTTSYEFRDAAHAQNLFALAEVGNIYTRIMNPTQGALEARINSLEGGCITAIGLPGTLVVASGQSAETLAILTLAESGDHVVASPSLYGGTYNLFHYTLPKLGIEVTFVDDPHDLEQWRAAIRPNTKAFYGEVLANPKNDVFDIEGVSTVAHDNGIPLIVDNTVPTPYLIRPIEWGADIVVHSLTKFIGGHGTSIGGSITDAGKFDFGASGRFPNFIEPDPSYHGLPYWPALGHGSFILKARVQMLRDLGMAISPFNAFLILQGLETLSLRMERHFQNAQKVAEFLAGRAEVENVAFAGLPAARGTSEPRSTAAARVTAASSPSTSSQRRAAPRGRPVRSSSRRCSSTATWPTSAMCAVSSSTRPAPPTANSPRTSSSPPGSARAWCVSAWASSRSTTSSPTSRSVSAPSQADQPPVAIDVRADLVEAHRRSLEHITAPGSRFDAATRVHIAEVVAEAYLRLDPPPPWARVHGDPVLNGAARLARHAGTITESWYHALLDEGLDPLDWIEVVGVVVSIVPVVAFARAIDAPVPEFPALRPGAPTGNVAAELASAALNWVPVAAPADQRASVVQALSALPDEDANLWRLAAAQYMSDAQMADPEWNRGSLSRPQMELIAGRLSLLRECFF